MSGEGLKPSRNDGADGVLWGVLSKGFFMLFFLNFKQIQQETT